MPERTKGTSEIQKLTWETIQNGDGLAILTTPNGTRTWYDRKKIPGLPKKNRKIGSNVEYPTEKDARKRMLEMRNELLGGDSFPPEQTMYEFLNRRKAHFSPNTVKNYESHIRNFVKAYAHFGITDMKGLTKDKFQQFFLYVRQTFSDYAATYGYSMLHGIYKWMVSTGKPISNPFDGMKKSFVTELKYSGQNLAHYTKPEPFKEFVKKVKGANNLPIARDCILAICHLPLRPMEMCKLVWSEIDFEARTIKIGPERNKTRKNLLFPITDQLMEILRRREKEANGDYVFPNRAGGTGHIKRDALSRLTKQIGEFDNIDIHGLRHTFSTIANDNMNLDPLCIEVILGHNTGTNISRVYNHSSYLDRKLSLLQVWSEFVDS